MTTGPFTLTSEAFKDGGSIPAEYSCQGADHSPALEWSGVPEGTGALVLVVDDMDANDFTHWIVVDLGPTETGLQKGIAPAADPPQQGRNDFGRVGWGGPCPPSGTHHYRFTLTAIAEPLQLETHPSRSAVDTALSGATVLGTAVLTGLYRRS
jgi:Raf kinase inhibitor-like YbhB/YbcL family protein